MTVERASHYITAAPYSLYFHTILLREAIVVQWLVPLPAGPVDIISNFHLGGIKQKIDKDSEVNVN